MHSPRETRGPLLVFLLAIFIATLSISGCAGVASAPITSPTQSAQLAVNPASVSVSTAIGSTGSQSVTATNVGNANLSISQANVTGAGFSVAGLTTPASLTPGQSQSFTVMFDATAAGSVSGSLSLMTNASSSPVVVQLLGTGASSPAVSSVTLSPSTASAIVSSTLPFTATVQGTTSNTAVTWKATLGAISAAGVYTAPANPGTDTVTATSVADTTKSASATVTVIATPSSPVVTSVTITPASASVATSGTVQFTASVQGTVTDKSVTWKAALGAITSAGVYTAPSKAGTDTVTATSNADTTKSASASVTVIAPPPNPVVTSVTISPTSASAITGGTVQFTASVQGTVVDKSVSWKVTLGTITSAGAYTAPASPGTDTVTATSNADTTKSASVTVTVATPVVNSVTVSPSPASTITGGTVQFTGTVAGTVTNKSVTWKVTLGTITSAGAYTAPATVGTDTITATSVADTTKSASATVTIAIPVVNSVTVSPASTSVTTGGTLQFTATIQGTVTDKSVTWTASLGSISAGGVYTAPASAGTDTITATSDADTTKSGTATVTVSVSQHTGALPAFPSAQGGGAAAAGGRGGQVIEVTNLNDSGAGSLRDCAKASGPRTCVIRVAGVIHPAATIDIRNPFLTIAGQTAPGGGITLQGNAIGSAPIFFITANDIVIRYLTCSIGLGSNHSPGPSAGASCVELASGKSQQNVIVDHMTFRWWDDKPYLMLSNSGFAPITNTVVQWSLMYEPNNAHQVGPMTDDTGGFASGDVNDDFHHNMFVNIGHRLPLYNTKSGRWVNNIVYNWDFYALLTQGGVKLDIINNKYVPGNLNGGNSNHEFDFNNSQSSDDPAGSMPGPPSPYLSGNVGPHQSNPAGDQTLMTSKGSEAGDTGGAVPSSWFRSSPLAAQTFPITADAVANLDSVILPTVGNSRMVDCDGNWVSRRDSVDTRIITQYQNNSAGGYFTVADSNHSVPSIAVGTPCTESLHDGIPDQWKTAQGLSTTDPNLHSSVAPNGYTYLENYMNGPAGSSASLKPDSKAWTWAANHPVSGATSASHPARNPSAQPPRTKALVNLLDDSLVQGFLTLPADPALFTSGSARVGLPRNSEWLTSSSHAEK